MVANKFIHEVAEVILRTTWPAQKMQKIPTNWSFARDLNDIITREVTNERRAVWLEETGDSKGCQLEMSKILHSRGSMMSRVGAKSQQKFQQAKCNCNFIEDLLIM